MEVLYKVTRWDRNEKDISEIHITRQTDKTVWFMHGETEIKELKKSNYYRYFSTKDEAVSLIKLMNESEKARKDDERIKDAAPELLEALEAAKSKIECSQRSHERASVILADEALEIMDAAIKLARGE